MVGFSCPPFSSSCSRLEIAHGLNPLIEHLVSAIDQPTQMHREDGRTCMELAEDEGGPGAGRGTTGPREQESPCVTKTGRDGTACSTTLLSSRGASLSSCNVHRLVCSGFVATDTS